jgi:hypothetical protein
MKNFLFTTVQLLLFLFVFFVCSVLPPFHLEHVLISTPGFTRSFMADGLVLMYVLYLVIILIEVLRKRVRFAAPWTTLAVVLATIFGLMMKFGFKTPSGF